MNATKGLSVKTGLKSGGIVRNHNRAGLKVKAGLKGGGMVWNHNRAVRR
jgi:hypothetical protein